MNCAQGSFCISNQISRGILFSEWRNLYFVWVSVFCWVLGGYNLEKLLASTLIRSELFLWLLPQILDDSTKKNSSRDVVKVYVHIPIMTKLGYIFRLTIDKETSFQKPSFFSVILKLSLSLTLKLIFIQ